MHQIDQGLDRVRGAAAAPNRTHITTKDGEVHSERTDYGYCVDKVRQDCSTANTGWFGTNRAAAAKCALDHLPTTCPPSLSGGGAR